VPSKSAANTHRDPPPKAPSPKGGLPVEQQLCVRAESAAILHLSQATLIRYENAGIIDKVQLVPGGAVRHRVAQINALAGVRK
jgi:hypothetical protein